MSFPVRIVSGSFTFLISPVFEQQSISEKSVLKNIVVKENSSILCTLKNNYLYNFHFKLDIYCPMNYNQNCLAIDAIANVTQDKFFSSIPFHLHHLVSTANHQMPPLPLVTKSDKRKLTHYTVVKN